MSSGVSGSNSAFRRRVERAAELRAVRASGSTARENDELNAAEAEERQKARQVDDADRVEYLIRDVMAQGKFDNLKYSGKPIPGLGEAYDPEWWVKGLIQRENITGLGPKAILLRTEDAEIDARLDAAVDRKAGPRDCEGLQRPRHRRPPRAPGRAARHHQRRATSSRRWPAGGPAAPPGRSRAAGTGAEAPMVAAAVERAGQAPPN